MLPGSNNQETMAIVYAAKTWTENPNHGKFNPGTAAGNKVFQSKVKGLPDNKRLSFENKNASLFWRLIESKEPSFGGVVSKIPTEWNDAGDATKFSNLILEYSRINIEMLQQNAFKRFDISLGVDDAIPVGPSSKRVLNPAGVAADKERFYNRVDSNVVAEWMQNVLDEVSFAKLLLKRTCFHSLINSMEP